MATRRRVVRTVRRYSPRRTYRRFRKGKAPIPILPTLAVADGLLIKPLLGNGTNIGGALNLINMGRYPEAGKEFVDVIGINFLGHKFSDGSSWPNEAIQNYTQIGLAVAGHWIANKSGVNRYIKKLPMIGKYIAL